MQKLSWSNGLPKRRLLSLHSCSSIWKITSPSRSFLAIPQWKHAQKHARCYSWGWFCCSGRPNEIKCQLLYASKLHKRSQCEDQRRSSSSLRSNATPASAAAFLAATTPAARNQCPVDRPDSIVVPTKIADPQQQVHRSPVVGQPATDGRFEATDLQRANPTANCNGVNPAARLTLIEPTK